MNAKQVLRGGRIGRGHRQAPQQMSYTTPQLTSDCGKCKRQPVQMADLYSCVICIVAAALPLAWLVLPFAAVPDCR